MGNKKDSRSVQTESLLTDGLAELLTKKELNKITVSELTRHAGINRVTFYDHFADVFDIYNKMMDAFFDELEKTLEDDAIVTYSDFFCAVIDLLANNKSLGKLAFSTPRIIEKAEDLFTTGCIAIWKEELGIKEITPEIRFLASYRVNGCIGILRSWAYDDYSYPVKKLKTYISEADETLDTSIRNMI